MRKISLIIVHCSATPASRDVCEKDIDLWHREKGWLGCGYHFVIKRDGTVETGRPVEKVGAHCLGHNKNSIGVCLVGGLSEDMKTPDVNYTNAQWTSLKILVVKLLNDYKAEVKGHNNFTKAKTCPNFDVPKWFKTGEIIPVLK